MDIVNIYENYNNYFDNDLKSVFELCSKTAKKYGFKIYLIGGIVRDMLLWINVKISENEPSLMWGEGRVSGQKLYSDIDITVEGDAIEFCRLLKKEASAKIPSVHESFGTAKVEINGKKIDFASTRSETYPKKGHLPVVEKIGCPLEFDVKRRDFTINSLALSLNQENFAQIIDYVGGIEDLKSKKLRILHDKSFIDDPTRIIRGLKFAVRLGFELDEKTLRLQEEYLKNINYDMSYKRVKNELKLTFGLNSQSAFDRFLNQGIYKLVSERLEMSKIIEEATLKLYQNIEEILIKYKVKHPWVVYFGIVAFGEDEAFFDKMQLSKGEKEIIMAAKELMESKSPDDDFGVYKKFAGKKVESLLLYALMCGEAEKVYHYLDDLSQIKLCVTGKDLLRLGVEPSKVYGDIFDYVLSKKIENPSMTKGDEIACIKGVLGDLHVTKH